MATATAEKTKTTTKKSGRKNSLAGFIIDALDRDVLVSFIADEKLTEIDTGKDVSTETIGVALTMHFQNTVKEDAMVECDRCGGQSPDTLSSCPYCGAEGEAEPATADAASDVEAEEEGDEDEEEGDEDEEEEGDEDEEEGDEDEEEGDEDEEEGDEDEEETPETDEKDDEEEEAQKPVKKTAKNTSKKTAKKSAGKEKVKMGAAAEVNGKSTALSKKSNTDLVSAKDLDNAVKEVEKLKSGAAKSYWALGAKLVEINENELWKLRVDENGKTRYSGFDAFVHHELKMSPTHAYNLMGFARAYSPDDLAELGTSKVALLLKAPPEDRERLAKEVKKGMPKRKLAKAVAEAKSKRGYEGATKQAQAATKAAKERAKKKAAAKSKVTVAVLDGKRTVKLFAKPATLRNLDMSALKRATKLGDVPFGKLELDNEASIIFSIQETKDGLVAVFYPQRDESTGE